MNMLLVFGVTLAAFLLVILAMAVGVIAGRKSISGSCGGLANQQGQGESCSMCSQPSPECRELREKASAQRQAAELVENATAE